MTDDQTQVPISSTAVDENMTEQLPVAPASPQAVTATAPSTTPAPAAAPASTDQPIPPKKGIEKKKKSSSTKKQKKDAARESFADDDILVVRGRASYLQALLSGKDVLGLGAKASKVSNNSDDTTSSSSSDDSEAPKEKKRGRKKGSVSKPPVTSEETKSLIGTKENGGLSKASSELAAEWRKIDRSSPDWVPWTVYMAKNREARFSQYKKNKPVDASSSTAQKVGKIRYDVIWDLYMSIPEASRPKWVYFSRDSEKIKKMLKEKTATPAPELATLAATASSAPQSTVMKD